MTPCRSAPRRRREDAFVDQPLAEIHAIVEIDFQDDDSCPPDGSAPDQDRAIPAKMPVPAMAARIEQFDDLSSLWINTRYVRAFMVVAGEAGQAQIAGTGRAAMLAGDDVVDLEMQLVLFVVYLAVFAAAARATPYQFYQFGVHPCLVRLGLAIAASPALK